MIRIPIIAYLCAFGVGQLSAATYYVSSSASNASDAGPGTQAQPWKTVAKVNATPLWPGDTVYFNRGDIWRETLVPSGCGNSTSRIVYSAYGTGNKPIICGANIVTGWTSYAGGTANTYSANLAASTVMVTKDSTYLKKGSSASTLTLNQYYWSAGVLYINVGANPSGNIIEAGQRNNAVSCTVPDNAPLRNYITVEGLALQKTNLANVLISNATNWIVQDCDLAFANNNSSAAGAGINGDRVHNGIFRNNYINYALGDGILAWRSSNVEISDNVIENVLDDGLDAGADGIQIGAKSSTPTACNNFKILNNVVTRHSTTVNKGCIIAEMGDNGIISGNYCVGGRFGIAPAGNNILVENNTVRSFGNGGGIRISQNMAMNGIKLHYNVVANSPGFAGITVTNDISGGSTHHTNFEIFNNVVYNTYYGIVVGQPFSGTVKNNISWSSATNPRIRFSVASIVPGGTVTINNNIWQDKGIESMISISGTTYYDMPSWQAATGHDLNSSTADPLFVNAGTYDFRLIAGSPAINAGASVGLIADHDGNAVPQGGAPDIGAYEGPGVPGSITYEAETLGYTASGATTSVITDAAAGGGQWIKLNGDSVGDYVQFTVPITAGARTISIKYKTDASRGKLRLRIVDDNSLVGGELDQYASTGSYLTTLIGTKTFTVTGNKTFRFEVSGKNSASTGYSLSIDSIVVQ